MIRIKDIELANISRYRGELMGAAMLFVILFHVSLPRSDYFFGLRRMGNIGVDMFLFLSGVGLWFSWKSHPEIKYFFSRRFLRIYPAWLVVAGVYYINDYLHQGPHCPDIITLIGELSVNINFWLHDELTFWYIPATMMLYLFTPWYMRLIERHPVYRWLPVIMIMWCILVQYVTPIHHLVGHLEIFWSRVPIYFIGINLGEMIRRKATIDGTAIWMIIVIFVMALTSSVFLEQTKHGQFPLFLERMLYIPLTVTAILLLNRIFRRTPHWFNTCFQTVGAISLECYLIHHHFVLVHIEALHWSYWPTFFVTIAITIPLAWLLHQALAVVINRIEKIIS